VHDAMVPGPVVGLSITVGLRTFMGAVPAAGAVWRSEHHMSRQPGNARRAIVRLAVLAGSAAVLGASASPALAGSPLMTLASYERRVTGTAALRIGAITIPASPVSLVETSITQPPASASLSGVFNLDGAAVSVCHQSQVLTISAPAQVSPGLWRLSCIARSSCSPTLSVSVANPSPSFSAGASLEMVTRLTFRVTLTGRSVVDLELLEEIAAEQSLSPADVGSVDGLLSSTWALHASAGVIASANFEQPVIGSTALPPLILNSRTTDLAWHLRPGTYELVWIARSTGSALARGGPIIGPRRATSGGRVLGVLNLSATTATSLSADIATTDGDPGGDGVIDNGDFSLFFLAFFANTGDPARLWADIADTDGAANPDGVVDNGDFTRFFADFFAPA